MASITTSANLAPSQFPPGTPQVNKIRYGLQKLGADGVTWAGAGAPIDVNPGMTATFVGVTDGTYRIYAQAMSTSGFIGSAVLSDPIVVDSRVTLEVPVSIGPPTVVV